MGIPLIQEFDSQSVARYDNYSDVGATTKPEDRGNWRRSSG
jgi:hypothetical protein